MDAGIRFGELLQYEEQETKRWKEWFAAHPEALERRCDIASAGTVRGLLVHLFATELHFAHAVLDLPEADWGKLRGQGVDQLFEVAEEARGKLQEFVAKAQPEDWEEIKELRSGKLKASKRKMVAQALLHGVHHRGQLATFLRQEGLGGVVGARFDCERCDGVKEKSRSLTAVRKRCDRVRDDTKRGRTYWKRFNTEKTERHRDHRDHREEHAFDDKAKKDLEYRTWRHRGRREEKMPGESRRYEKVEKADPSQSFANDATGFGMTGPLRSERGAVGAAARRRARHSGCCPESCDVVPLQRQRRGGQGWGKSGKEVPSGQAFERGRCRSMAKNDRSTRV
jgi:uncharacterized damage-inducible protein DinB